MKTFGRGGDSFGRGGFFAGGMARMMAGDGGGVDTCLAKPESAGLAGSPLEPHFLIMRAIRLHTNCCPASGFPRVSCQPK